MAKEKANELFQSILRAEFPEQWKELEKNCTTDRYSCLPYIGTNYTHLIHSSTRKERDEMRKRMETTAREKFNELIMEVELGGIKKDEVMAMIAKMDELGFGNCTNTRACEAVCPKCETIANIARLNREFIKAKLAD